MDHGRELHLDAQDAAWWQRATPPLLSHLPDSHGSGLEDAFRFTLFRGFTDGRSD
jgi:hypothetical protein